MTQLLTFLFEFFGYLMFVDHRLLMDCEMLLFDSGRDALLNCVWDAEASAASKLVGEIRTCK